MTTDPANLVGTVVADRYQVIRILGAGSGGAVCEVTDLSTNNPAALKLLVGDDPDLAARLEREGKALSMLAHPHIVELVDTGILDDGRPYVVTELVRGVSLQQLIDTSVFEPRRALAIIRQLLEALHHAHGAGLIHRDIKPENILVAEGGDGGDFIKLLDFGVAKVLDPNVIDEENLTRAGLKVFGTPAYMAPEVVIGEPIDARTDLYSVGIVLFEMLVGRLPFEHPERVTLMRKHVTDRPPLLRDAAPDRAFPPELEQLVGTALQKLPDHRFASALAMHTAVQSVDRSIESSVGRPAMPMDRPVLMSSPAANQVQHARPNIWDRMRRFLRELAAAARRHPRRSAAIGSAVVLLLILVIAIGGSSTPSPADKPVAPVVTPSVPDVPAAARALVTQADGELAKKRYGRAIAAYERGLATDRALGRDDKLRTAIARIASRADPVTAVIALEILATRLEPPDTKTITELASTSRQLEVRRRAFVIAERDGFAKSVDRLASWTLDLQQGTCDERREAIAKLRELGDKRAVDPLQKARALPCLAKDAAAAIAQLQPPP